MCVIKRLLLFVSANYIAGGNAYTQSYTKNVEEAEFELTFFNNSIDIFLENNEKGQILHRQIQKVLQEKELQFAELNEKFIHFTDSDREHNDFVRANSTFLRKSLENDLKNIFNNSTVRKRSERKILRKIVDIILEILSRVFTTTTTSTTTMSTTTVSNVTDESDGRGKSSGRTKNEHAKNI